MSFKIAPIVCEDQTAVLKIVKQFWGDATIVIHGEVFHPQALQGFKATINGKTVGILHYHINNNVCEIITLASLSQGIGVGSSLLNTVESLAASNHCQKLRVTTTNDNLHALGFYQRRGFHLVRLRPNQLKKSRQIKPNIPLVGENKITLRDELVLEKHIETHQLTV